MFIYKQKKIATLRPNYMQRCDFFLNYPNFIGIKLQQKCKEH